MKKNFIFYILTFSIFCFLLIFLIEKGSKLKPLNRPVNQESQFVPSTARPSTLNIFIKGFSENITHPLSILLLQIIAIIIIARLFGTLFQKMGQPTVIGEILAGIFLGPSVLGYYLPNFSVFLFPPGSLNNLHVLSQIGLMFFMFIIGMELDSSVFKKKANSAIMISYSGIIIPFISGVILSYFLFPLYASGKSTFAGFSIFLGISMSITAFPVLARIIHEKGLTRSPLGAMSITVAAIGDITGWCLLAFIIAIVKAGSISNALFTLIFSAIYIFFMFYVLHPFLKKLSEIYVSKENLTQPVVAFVFLLLIMSSYLTEIIGIHALFGAFIAGVIIPRDRDFKKLLAEKIEDISLILLLPLFFVYTGLRTKVGILDQESLWFCLVVILTAIVGKFLGTTFSARFVGISWKNSLLLGSLMNTRGLMELIVINIGYDMGILTSQIFVMMVIMAIFTTLMTGPSINLINFLFKRKEPILAAEIPKYKVLFSFADPGMGNKLLKLADILTGKEAFNTEITAFHVYPFSEMSIQNIFQFDETLFQPVKDTAEELGINLRTKYKVSNNIPQKIQNYCQKRNVDLLLMGAAKSPFTSKKTGGIVHNLLVQDKCHVGILIDNGLTDLKNIFVYIDQNPDLFLANYAKRIAENSTCQVKIFLSEEVTDFQSTGNYYQWVELQNGNSPQFRKNKAHDLILLSYNYWKEIENTYHSPSSVLILK
ncbi:MAG: cation:proton antiporter [Bacteroidota bacterium]|nr:cation:proton antiporter [Bacteroidota bacterium]MDP4225611.1 cation:proton antiporter [Bacteroidota bacterium]